MMVTLVTGVPGWLGTRLLNKLAGEGYHLRCLVKTSESISSLSTHNDIPCELVRGDVRKPSTLKEATVDVDTVFHLAAVLHSVRVRDFYDVNAAGTRNLLEASLRSGVRRFIHVSSNSASGPPPSAGFEMTESSPLKPLTPYGKSKLLAEGHVMSFHEETGLKTTILRPCWLYGPGQPSRMFYFMKAAAAGRFPLFGDGRTLVSMSYVDDVVSALLLARDSRLAIGEVYLVADEEPYPAIRVYRAAAAAFGAPFRTMRLPRYVSLASGSLNRLANRVGFDLAPLRQLEDFAFDRAYSTEKTRRDLGFCPTMKVEGGMKAAVEWARSEGML